MNNFCLICYEDLKNNLNYIYTSDTKSYICQECKDIYVNNEFNKKKKYSNKNKG